ncbi:hypothetical protein [Agromyces archimandritae]|uniref:Hemagglutinin n=1 Tax=Agromyces archimandritae TaxID=2781962 RepID=A0A975FQ36_9MICO|nr:hypothetical protein [Agromyces archimandritae]QTX05131.1 hypothetical protein G127AT_02545 [Agromyces archimandritae]
MSWAGSRTGAEPERAGPRRGIRTAVAALAALLVAGILAACANAAPNEHFERRDPDPARFDAGLIVSDDGFYNAGAMTEAQIAAFLQGLDCQPLDFARCVADYWQDTDDQPAGGGPGHCEPYEGADREPAARIIKKISEACGISPRVLLVLMQKEQSLLTKPTMYGYERATGYGCPDTADCDRQYFGFFNQLYHAAWQFRQYTQEPERTYKIGQVDVGYHPNAECGASAVDIRNQATANLYNYTPYQPNEQALANPDAEGDACSSWGNFNFWLLWNRWFGDPTTERFPGFLPPCTGLAGGQPCRPVPAVPQG